MKTLVKQTVLENEIHVALVNKYIKEEVKIADEKHPKTTNVSDDARKRGWDRAYHRAMNRMTIEAGLRCA